MESGGELGLIEGWATRSFRRINEHIGNSGRIRIAIPEAAVPQPLRAYDALVGERIDVVTHEALGGCVVLGGILLRLLRKGGKTKDERGEGYGRGSHG